MATPLAISPSLLKTFLTCPRQYQAKYITKEVVFQQNEAAAFGDRVHKSVEEALTLGAALTPEAEFMQPLVDCCRELAELPGMTMFVEHKLCITRNFEPTTWSGRGDKQRWLGGVADVFFRDDTHKLNIIIDWKTGKPRYDKTQTHLLATCARYTTGYTKTLTFLVHVRHEKIFADSLNLVDLSPVQGLLLDVQRYEKACEKDMFPPTPNGLCRNWCDVKSCPHNGK